MCIYTVRSRLESLNGLTTAVGLVRLLARWCLEQKSFLHSNFRYKLDLPYYNIHFRSSLGTMYQLNQYFTHHERVSAL